MSKKNTDINTTFRFDPKFHERLRVAVARKRMSIQQAVEASLQEFMGIEGRFLLLKQPGTAERIRAAARASRMRLDDFLLEAIAAKKPDWTPAEEKIAALAVAILNLRGTGTADLALHAMDMVAAEMDKAPKAHHRGDVKKRTA